MSVSVSGNSITACVTKTDQISMNPAVVMDSIFTAAAWCVNQHDLPQSCHNYPLIEHRISTNCHKVCRDESLYFTAC